MTTSTAVTAATSRFMEKSGSGEATDSKHIKIIKVSVLSHADEPESHMSRLVAG